MTSALACSSSALLDRQIEQPHRPARAASAAPEPATLRMSENAAGGGVGLRGSRVFFPSDIEFWPCRSY